MRKLTFLFLLLPLFAFSTNFYVSPTGNNSNSGTILSPWLTWAKVRSAGQAGTIKAGDSVLFQCGGLYTVSDVFHGMTWWTAAAGGSSPDGTPGHPIVFSCYGDRSLGLPNSLFPSPASTDSTSRVVISFEGCHYIVVYRMQFNDTRKPVSKMLAAACSAGIQFGERGGGQESYNCKADSIYINGCGDGIVIVGGTDTIVNSYMENFGNVLAIGSGSFGANPIIYSGNHHYFAYNTLKDGWAYSSAFGTNGGAFEAFNTCDSNKILYNICIDNGGIQEAGATAGASTFKHDSIAFNYFVNNGNINYINVSGAFSITPDSICYFHNTIVENKQSRWTGANYGDGIDTFPTWPSLPSAERYLFQNNGSPAAATVYRSANNVVYNTNNMNPYQNNTSKFKDTTSLYFLKGGSGSGFTFNSTSVQTSAKIFTDTTASNPAAWNTYLTVQFLLGVNLGIGPYYNGTAVKVPIVPGWLSLALPPNSIPIPFIIIVNGVPVTIKHVQ